MGKLRFSEEEIKNFDKNFLDAYYLGRGDFSVAYVHPEDDSKVVLISKEYKEQELKKMSEITKRLNEQGVNIAVIHDSFKYTKTSPNNISQPQNTNKIKNETTTNEEENVILEDRIVGIPVYGQIEYGKNKNKWLRLLSLDDKLVAKAFEDMEKIIASGIQLDLIKADNVIWTPQGYSFIDFHKPDNKVLYLTDNLSQAIYLLCSNLLYNGIIDQNAVDSKREFMEMMVLRSLCYYKLSNCIQMANIDELEKDKAVQTVSYSMSTIINDYKKIYPYLSEGEALDNAMIKTLNKIKNNQYEENSSSPQSTMSNEIIP